MIFFQTDVAQVTESLISDPERLSFLNVTGSVSEWLQLRSSPVKPLVNESGSPAPPEELAEQEDTETDLDKSNTMFVTDWLPPEPLRCIELPAIPT